MDDLHLVRDVLDKPLVDRNGAPLGRVDGLVLVARKGRPPRVAGLEAGPTVLADRISPGLGRRVRKLLGRLGERAGKPVRIEMDRVRHFGLSLQVDVDARRTSAYAIETWLREKVVSRIPGGKGGAGEKAGKAGKR